MDWCQSFEGLDNRVTDKRIYKYCHLSILENNSKQGRRITTLSPQNKLLETTIKFQVTWFVAEFWNTISNLGMIGTYSNFLCTIKHHNTTW